MTGALYAVHPDFLFTLDNTSNFAPGTSTESWFATSGTMPYAVSPTVIEDRPVNGPLLQQNRFSLSQNLTRLLAHVRTQGPWFVLGGVNFHAQSYKRFGFQVLQPAVVNAPADAVVDESTSEVLLEAGVALESERVKHADRHYSLRFSMAKPVWRRLDNTAWPDVTFTGTSGWDARLEGRYSVAVHELVHVGGWAQYLYAQRGSQIRGAYELPLTHTRSVAFGLEVLWKL
ncbi:MAG TPA: hypothetical protein VFW93_00945 [Aquabacterium sp.]|uniref:hypothetical protein n=1 Tax=Aquabacterium sp. TaxID=1872578 RepID=UPI002E3374D2|nr:hypothetical protein [Aquabacterium sp.]HEX5354752.1 hypothetical protein [Aquabacterium sp.]